MPVSNGRSYLVNFVDNWEGVALPDICSLNWRSEYEQELLCIREIFDEYILRGAPLSPMLSDDDEQLSLNSILDACIIRYEPLSPILSVPIQQIDSASPNMTDPTAQD